MIDIGNMVLLQEEPFGFFVKCTWCRNFVIFPCLAYEDAERCRNYKKHLEDA